MHTPKWLSTAGNQFNSWGFPQVPYSSPGLCRTVKTIGFEFGLKPLEASNIGSDSKSCPHSTRKQRKLFIRTSGSESCSSEQVAAKAVHHDEWQRKLFIRTSNSNSKGCSTNPQRRQQAARAVLLRGHQRQHQRVQQIFFGAQSARRICRLS
jgi:hypothetical protein